MADAAAAAPAAPHTRVHPTPPTGLSGSEVAERRSRGLANTGTERTSRSLTEILRANILTRFNFILGALLAVILAVGEPQDALFGLVLVANTLIGIAQELRAKRTLDRLAVLSAPQVRVIRDGSPQDIPVDGLVADDLVDLRPGDQLVADGVVHASNTPRMKLNRVKMFARRISGSERLVRSAPVFASPRERRSATSALLRPAGGVW